jgi:DNA-binding MarR family transcriptional regulator
VATSGDWDAASYEEHARAAVARVLPEGRFDAMAVCFNLIRAANRVQQDLETSVHRPAGLTWAAFRVMFTIFSTGPIAPTQIARLSSISGPSASSVLNTLERNELVRRRPSEIDARSVTVELTALGLETATAMIVTNNARETMWAEVLTPGERAIFAELLRKLLAYHPKP